MDIDTISDGSFGRAAAPPSPKDHTGSLLRRSAVRTQRIMQSVMPERTEPRFYAIMVALAGADALSQKDLADRLNINRTVMVKLIDRLEAEEFVVRARNPADRRSYTLALTDEGRRARDLMGPAIARGETLFASPLTSVEQLRLTELLGRLLPELDETVSHPAHRRTGYLLLQADMRMRRRTEQALATVDLHTRHLAALTALDAIGPCPQQQLAQELGIAETAMVLTVDEMEAGGLVERRRDSQDRRRYALALTDQGRAKLAEAVSAVDDLQTELIDELGEADDAELRTLLAKTAGTGDEGAL